MAWRPVNFDYVRYSPIERIHYFWDPEYPQWIQFLRCDKWCSWHVCYVQKYNLCNTPLQTQIRLTVNRHAVDPKIKNIAKKAEVLLLDIPSATQKPRPSQSSTLPVPYSA